jgi:DNA polymerase-3 subunit epsilon
MREIVLDTETTGTDAQTDRIIEIGCVELVNHVPTGKTFHVYLNPQRPVSAGAFAVHGLSNEFLADKPVFDAVADEFLAFIADGQLVIHNAAFDMGFLNAELKRCGRPVLDNGRALDTLTMARRKHPGAPNNLDALCQRYGIDNARRTKHGALLDSEILAEVYLELIGGRQVGFDLQAARAARIETTSESVRPLERPEPLAPRIRDADLAAHAAFLAGLSGQAVWRDYIPPDDNQA